MTERSASRHRPAAITVVWVFVVAVLVNFPWELAQVGLGLFADIASREMVFCAACSLGDGLLVLLILGSGRLVFGTVNWFVRAGLREYVLMVSAGAALAITVELVAISGGVWRYERTMPLLPGARVGLLPVLQMTLLPPVIFRLVAAIRRAQ